MAEYQQYQDATVEEDEEYEEEAQPEETAEWPLMNSPSVGPF